MLSRILEMINLPTSKNDNFLVLSEITPKEDVKLLFTIFLLSYKILFEVFLL